MPTAVGEPRTKGNPGSRCTGIPARVGTRGEMCPRLHAAEGREQLAQVTHELSNGVAHRVLVVDDNVDAASMLAALVRQLGHDVVVVHDGPSALQAAQAYRPEIILLDLGMPDMNGFEVARALRERGIAPTPRIVAVTGWGKPEDERRTREAGFDMHLIKPVEESQIRQVLRLRGPRPTRH